MKANGIDRRQTSATIMLVVVTAVWGLSFPLVKDWQTAAARHGSLWRGLSPLHQEVLASMTLIAIRTALAVGVLALFRPRQLLRVTKREHARGLLLGLVFFTGFGLQTVGQARTTPALSAFITSLCSGWVPLILWGVFRVTAPGITLIGIGLGMIGTVVLSAGGESTGDASGGELLTFVSSILFAVELIMLDRFGRQVNSAHLTTPFLGVTAVLAGIVATCVAAAGPGLFAWWTWLRAMLGDPVVLRATGLLVLTTIFTFHWMNVYQPRVPAARAALIYLLEPLFSTVFSLLWEHDKPNWHLAAGGGLILAGNLLVELPRWFRERPRSTTPLEPSHD
jgi:drug/metabolite transporter (DMT)-like permease